MSIKQGALSGLVVLLACASSLRARPKTEDLVPPPTVNLDIPPDDPVDAEDLQEQDQARHSVRFPLEFHDLVLKMRPEWKQLEDDMTPPIQDPIAYGKKHPKAPEQLKAEEKAEQAIINPRRPVVLPN